MTLPEILREKSKAYELNGLAYNDRGETSSAIGFFAAALVFTELANALDEGATLDTSDHPQAA